MRAEWERGELVSVYTAAKHLRAKHATLKRAADEGYVEGVIRTEKGGYFATPKAWEKGYKAYIRAKYRVNPPGVPRGWITASEAARRLGVGEQTMWAIARSRLVPLYIHRSGKNVLYFAHPQAWERALYWWKQGRVQQGRQTASQVGDEKARRRLAALTPYQRLALRVYIRAVMLGVPLDQDWGRRLRDEYEAVAAMYGWPESA